MNLAETFETRFAELKTLVTSKASLEAKITELNTISSDLGTKLATALQEREDQAALAKSNGEKHTAALKTIAELQGVSETSAKEIEKLKAESKDIAKLASEKAASMLAGQSIPLAILPKTDVAKGGGEAAKQSVLEQYGALCQAAASDRTGEAAIKATEFLKAHRAELKI